MTADRFIELNGHFRDITESGDAEAAVLRSYYSLPPLNNFLAVWPERYQPGYFGRNELR